METTNETAERLMLMTDNVGPNIISQERCGVIYYQNFQFANSLFVREMLCVSALFWYCVYSHLFGV